MIRFQDALVRLIDDAFCHCSYPPQRSFRRETVHCTLNMYNKPPTPDTFHLPFLALSREVQHQLPTPHKTPYNAKKAKRISLPRR
jgi:hypothetical protein